MTSGHLKTPDPKRPNDHVFVTSWRARFAAWRWPLVSRRAYDQAVARAQTAEARERHSVENADDRANEAEASLLRQQRRNDTMFGEASKCLAEARGALASAVEMTRLAQETIIGRDAPEGISPKRRSVRENDAAAAQRLRDEAVTS